MSNTFKEKSNTTKSAKRTFSCAGTGSTITQQRDDDLLYCNNILDYDSPVQNLNCQARFLEVQFANLSKTCQYVCVLLSSNHRRFCGPSSRNTADGIAYSYTNLVHR